ncbi:pentapeptide repeat-containing protein [Variovorax paradoxus]|uniref:pentapeptide repeat-containing protein n=1 Tax=Variovorax paradoxus TaxID=34073 RepID=UPI002786964A|nr:pentapeptide repeat-containing protein [Variovorax paradoxus]MDQ0591359.1 uncharacterized protein YjbI with pentapeptide repeats [Variovorax paradoxus]
MSKYLTLTASSPFVPPLQLPMLHDARSTIEKAVADGVSFTGRMIDVDLTAAILTGMQAEGATFVGSLENAKLDGAKLARATITRCLTGASLVNADLTQAHISGIDASNLKASGADLHSVNAQGTNLSHGDFRRVQFNAAKLQRALLVDADVAGANVHLANVTHEQLETCRTPFDDIRSLATTGRTLAQRADAEAEAAAVGAIKRF